MTPKQEKFFEKTVRMMKYEGYFALDRLTTHIEVKRYRVPSEFAEAVHHLENAGLTQTIERYFPDFGPATKKHDSLLKIKHSELVVFTIRSDDPINPPTIYLSRDLFKKEKGKKVFSVEIMGSGGAALPKIIKEQIELIGAEEVFNYATAKLNNEAVQ